MRWPITENLIMPHGFTHDEWTWFEENRRDRHLVLARIVATGDPRTPSLVKIDECPFCEQAHYHFGLEHGLRRPPCRFEDLPPRMFQSTDEVPDYYLVVAGLPCPTATGEVLRLLRAVQLSIERIREIVSGMRSGCEGIS